MGINLKGTNFKGINEQGKTCREQTSVERAWRLSGSHHGWKNLGGNYRRDKRSGNNMYGTSEKENAGNWTDEGTCMH